MARNFTKAMSRDPLDDIEWPGWEEAGAMAKPAPTPPADDTKLMAEGEAIQTQPAEDIALPAEEEAIEVQSAEDTELKAEREAIDAQTAEDTEVMVAGETMDLQPAADLADAQAEIEPPETNADREAESEPETQEGQADTLSQLVATIDQEIEQALGSEAIAALVSAAPARDSGEEQYAIFALTGTEYAVSLSNVIEVGRPPNVTPVPNVPDWVLGVANLRGDIISMVDLRAFLGLERTNLGRDSRILVVQAHRGVVTTGLVVDQLSGIGYLAEDRIGPPNGPIEDRVTPYLRGMYEQDGRLLVVLDLDGLLLSPEMRQFEPM